MRIPNMRKLKVNDFDNRLYEVRSFTKSEEIKDVVKFGFLDEKEKTRFIGSIEKTIRASYEYKKFISFLKDELDMSECTFFSKLNTKIKNIKIEIHHDPFSLFDLVNICINYFISQEWELNDFAIAEEVMRWHFMGLIGLIPLSCTVHGLVHQGKIFIPINFPFGDIKKFYEEYNMYMEDGYKETFASIIERSAQFVDETPDVLKKRFVYLSVDGFELPENV